MPKIRGIQCNIYLTDELARELDADALALTKARLCEHSRQDVFKLAHRAWKNLQANAKKGAK